jgi:hypothetical protein
MGREERWGVEGGFYQLSSFFDFMKDLVSGFGLLEVLFVFSLKFRIIETVTFVLGH